MDNALDKSTLLRKWGGYKEGRERKLCLKTNVGEKNPFSIKFKSKFFI